MKKLYTYAFSALLISGLSLQACGSNPGVDDDDDDGDIIPIGGAGPGSGGAGTGGGGPGTGGDGPIFVPPDRPDCSSEPNGTQASGPINGEPCWDLTGCNAQRPEQFLQQCGATNCLPFNNNRIDNFEEGGILPGL